MYDEQISDYIEQCLKNGAWLISLTNNEHLGIEVFYQKQDYCPIEEKYYQGYRDGIEHFISEKPEDVVRALQERFESDRSILEGEIVRHFRTRMIDSHQLEEWYVYILDKD